MGSLNSSHQQSPSSSLDDVLSVTPKVRRSRRFMDKIRNRQPSRSDLIVAQTLGIDPNLSTSSKAKRAQALEGEIQRTSTADLDLDQIIIKLKDEEETESAKNNETTQTPESSEKPVFDEDRHFTHTTNTSSPACIETESTKHNADKAISCTSSATDERSREFFAHDLNSPANQLNGEDYPISYETESWRSAKNWKSVSNSSDQEPSSHGQSIVIREAQTSSSSESNFTDPHSPSKEKLQNLSIARLEQFNLFSDVPELQSVYEEMPIVKKSEDNGVDKGMFCASRFKKVELSEIPLAKDICATPPSEPQTVTTPTHSNNNNVVKASNGNSNSGGKVLHRVITLTTADNNHSPKTTKPPPPTYVPEKLHFSTYEKFEGQMLMNWFAQSLQTIQSLTTSLNENDMNALTLQYCNNLLEAGVIKQLDASSDSFKPNSMYQWTYKEASVTHPTTPGKLDTCIVWPPASEKKSSPKGESKIPKLMSSSSTPKARIQLVSSLFTLTDPTPQPVTNGADIDNNKIAELKTKIGKCETIQDMVQLVRSFMNDNSMVSSESSTNSGIFSNSLMNGSDSTVFDRSMETTVFNVLQQRPQETPSPTKTPPRGKSAVRSRTTPNTPTGSTTRLDPKKIRRNLSVDSVNNGSPKVNEAVNGNVSCKRCVHTLTSPNKTSSKRMVDKATVMDVDPIVVEKSLEVRTIETQTEPEVKEEKAEEVKETIIPSAPAPPPPPMMNAPPPPPMPMKPPGPPPPPMPGNSISPVPPPPNLPPPLPFGLSSSPMPLPPPITVNSGQALRKKAVNPPKSMKPLYWTRIVAPIKTPDSTDGAQPASLSPDEKENEDDEELWKEIDETKLDNLDEFTELFSRQGVVPKAKASTPLPKVKAIKVLDSKRSQNVGIFVRSIHVDFAEIEHAIYHCDTSVISLETLQHIMEIKASNEELAMIREASSSFTEGSPPLDAPESFLLRISEVSSSAERISCIVFQAEFDEQCTMVSRKLMTVKSLCEFLLENEGLKEVFSIILTLGNFMNGGNRQRGQADGFGLEILGKLKDVKSKDPKITLLHFIVKTYIERCRKSGCAISDLVLPVPNPNDVDKSLSIDFEECKQQLNALKTKVAECKKTTEKVIAASAEDCVQPFKEKMEMFLEMAINKIESRYQKLEECHVVFVKTIKFYKFLPKKGTLEETAPAQFFEYWTSFTSDFNDIFKKELVILTNELLKKSRQVTKPQSKPTSGENNLKARINRLKNRNN